MEVLQQSIDPSILHKSHGDDVLVTAPDIIVPAHVDIGLLDAAAVLELSGGDAAPYRRDGGRLVLRTLPSVIAVGDLPDPDTFELSLSAFYETDGATLTLSASHVPHGVERMLSRRFLPQVMPLAASEKAAVVSLLGARHAGFVPAWSYKVLNDTRNYFFYRKDHEHVPGLMIIEIARQSMYHYFYNTYAYRRGEVTISMSDLGVSFINYMESAYEVEVIVKQTAAPFHATPKHVDTMATFFQNGRPVAEIRLRGGVMKTMVFNRLRTLPIPDHHWFAPSGRVGKSALLDLADGTSISATLKELSPGAFVVEPNKPLDLMAKIERCVVAADGFGLVPFGVADAYPALDRAIVLELSFASHAKLSTLREILKRHCFFSRAEVPDVPVAEIRPALLNTAEA
jgi:hypothetical protein